jgi:hypothetical protein
MSRGIYDDSHLSREAAMNLIHNLVRPDMNALTKLDNVLAKIEATIIFNEDGGFEIDCPDINIDLT